MAARWLMTRAAGVDRSGSADLRFDAIGVEVDRRAASSNAIEAF